MNQIKLLIDCGATSAKVATVGRATELYHIPGFNPYHHDGETFRQALISLKQELISDVDEVIFYGTGMGRAVHAEKMQSMLSQTFDLPSSHIEVHSDLMICAHAAYHEQPVIIGILGTGSNVGYYDGQNLDRRTPSLGYILGDEGSGVDIGRRMLRAYMYHELPTIVSNRIEQKQELSLAFVLDQTYAQNNLRALASNLAPVASEFRDMPYMKQLVHASFTDYIRSRLAPECVDRPANVEIVIFGSVADVFRDDLELVATDLLDRKVQVHKSPLRVLIDKLIR